MDADQQTFEQLKAIGDSATAIVGMGSVLKGDDAVGPLVCEQVAGKVSADVIDVGTVPENYIGPVVRKAPRTLLVIDAIDFGAEPGTIKLFKPDELSSIAISTHTLSPGFFIDLIRKEIDLDAYFIGIQPAQVRLGEPVSNEVADAIQRLSEMLTEVYAAGG